MSTPDLTDEVTIATPARAFIPARVAAVGASHLDLALLTPSEASRHELAGQSVAVEFVNDDGICHLVGTLTEEGELLRFAFTGSPQLLQRRAFIRADASVPVVFILDGHEAVATEALTLNVSGGGLLVTGLKHFRVGDTMSFTFDLFGGHPIEGDCRLVRGTDDGAYGVMFTHIADRDRDAIIRWAFERQREERDRRRESQMEAAPG